MTPRSRLRRVVVLAVLAGCASLMPAASSWAQDTAGGVGATGATGPTGAAGATSPAPPAPPPPVLPSALKITESDADIALPLAVSQAAAGDLAGAITRLTAAAGLEGPAQRRADIASELERMRGLDAYRNRVLEWRRTSGEPVQLEGTKGKVTRIAEGKFTVETAGGKAREFPVSAASPEVLLRWQRQAAAQGGDDGPLAYAWQLTPSDELRKNTQAWVCRQTGLSTAALQAEFEVQSARCQSAIAADLLVDLAGRRVPGDAGEARAQLASIKALLPGHAGDPLVSARIAVLHDLARQALGITFDADPLSNLGLSGKVEFPGPGQLHLAYAFDDERQLADFDPVDASYLRSLRETWGELDARWSARRMEIEDGHLLLRGAAALRSTWKLCAPWKLSFTVRWPKDEPEAKHHAFILGFCDDGHESMIRCGIGLLEVIDKRSGHFARVQMPSKSFFIGTDYRIELKHDGHTVQMSIDGNSEGSMPSGPRLSGALLLWTHSELDITIDDFVVEGLSPPPYVAQRREAWIELGVSTLK